MKEVGRKLLDIKLIRRVFDCFDWFWWFWKIRDEIFFFVSRCFELIVLIDDAYFDKLFCFLVLQKQFFALKPHSNNLVDHLKCLTENVIWILWKISFFLTFGFIMAKFRFADLEQPLTWDPCAFSVAFTLVLDIKLILSVIKGIRFGDGVGVIVIRSWLVGCGLTGFSFRDDFVHSQYACTIWILFLILKGLFEQKRKKQNLYTIKAIESS